MAFPMGIGVAGVSCTEAVTIASAIRQPISDRMSVEEMAVGVGATDS